MKCQVSYIFLFLFLFHYIYFITLFHFFSSYLLSCLFLSCLCLFISTFRASLHLLVYHSLSLYTHRRYYIASLRCEELSNNNCRKFGRRYPSDIFVRTKCEKFFWRRKILCKIHVSYAVRTIS